MDVLKNFLDRILGNATDVVYALILLVIALIAACVAKLLVVKILRALKLEEKLSKKTGSGEAVGSAVTMIGKLVFAIVFLLFLPGALDKLGMSSVSAPISTMIGSFINYLPNIIAAIIIVAFGAFLAKLVKQLLAGILKKTKVDTVQEKLGLKLSEGMGISDILAGVLYVIILFVAIVAALQVLNIEAISVPAIGMLNSIIAMIPNVCIAIVLVIVGAFIAKLVSKLLEEVLAGTGFDKVIASIPPKDHSVKGSRVVGIAVRTIIDIIFVVEALRILKLQVFTQLGTAVIAYLPSVIAAAIILAVAILLANFVKSMILKKNENATISANTAKCAILVVAGFMALSQLGIASRIVDTAFVLLIAAVAVAFAIAFGIGGRDMAKKLLERADGKITAGKPEEKQEDGKEK